MIPEHVRRFLEKPNVAVLATISPSGRPQATPVWFLVEDGRILINTSRGEVLDDAALAAAIREKKIAGAAIDVFDPEPPKAARERPPRAGSAR